MSYCDNCGHNLQYHNIEGCKWLFFDQTKCRCILTKFTKSERLSQYRLNDYGRNNPALYTREVG